jgi:hypothetical protein
MFFSEGQEVNTVNPAGRVPLKVTYRSADELTGLSFKVGLASSGPHKWGKYGLEIQLIELLRIREVKRASYADRYVCDRRVAFPDLTNHCGRMEDTLDAVSVLVRRPALLLPRPLERWHSRLPVKPAHLRLGPRRPGRQFVLRRNIGSRLR